MASAAGPTHEMGLGFPACYNDATTRYRAPDTKRKRHDHIRHRGACHHRPVHALVEKHGGRYLAETPEVRKMEGDADAPNVIALLEFPDQAAVEALYADPE